jgi:hypothetical protein
MRESILIVAAAGLLAACGSPEPAGNEAAPAASARPAERAAAVPAAFQGIYDESREACRRPSEYRLTVSAHDLRFHESIGAVREVAVEGPDAIRVDADYQGEGESWRATHRLRLDDGGATLTIVGNGTKLRRVRCGVAASEGPPLGPHWGEVVSEGDAALVLTGTDGKALLTLACPRGSDELAVNVHAFRPVASEERMTFGAAGTAVTLVADARGDPGRGGVTGRGPVPAELPAILATAEGIVVNYGSQNSGPHPGPSAQGARYLVSECRD